MRSKTLSGLQLCNLWLTTPNFAPFEIETPGQD